MSALPPEADMLVVGINVCYVPEAEVKLKAPYAIRGEVASAADY